MYPPPSTPTSNPAGVQQIAVLTGSRADYGLLEPVMRAIDLHPQLALQCVVAGTHHTTASRDDIAFPTAAAIPMQRINETGRDADAYALGRGVAGVAQALVDLRPHWVVVLGDRIEAFAAAAAAAVGGHRLAHLHGGDRAQGVADESLRHAISKLAHLHLPATDVSAQRLVQMGEDPARVHVVGSPAVDGIQAIGPDPNAPQLIVILHPVGDHEHAEHARMATLLRVTQSHRRMVLAPNADPGAAGIRRAIEEAGITPVEHLPRPRFLAVLKGARALVGNSSAGLIEAAVCGTPAVNIGPRQAGRETPPSVTSCDHGAGCIVAALDRALSLDTTTLSHPYGAGDTGPRVAALFAKLNPAAVPLHKRNMF